MLPEEYKPKLFFYKSAQAVIADTHFHSITFSFSSFSTIFNPLCSQRAASFNSSTDSSTEYLCISLNHWPPLQKNRVQPWKKENE